MSYLVRAALLAFAAFLLTTSATADDKKPAQQGVKLKTIISVSGTLTQENGKRTLTVTAVGQVPTGGWKGAKLVRRAVKDAPKDGIYDYDMTAVRPKGFVTQVISKVTAKDVWENPPADLKGVKVHGIGEGVRTIKIGLK